MIQIINKDFAITNFACFSCTANGFDNLIYLAIINSSFNFNFWQKIHHILSTTVEFGMPFLSTEAFYFNHGDTRDPYFRECFTHIV